MTKLMTRLVAFLFAVLAFCPLAAHADIKVDITQGVSEPIPIAIPAFYGANGNESQYGRDIAGVVSNDLVRSGLFAAVDPKSFVQDAGSLLVAPHFADWRVLNAQALVVGKVEAQADGRLKVEFRLWDVFAEQQMTGPSLISPLPPTGAGWRTSWRTRFISALRAKKAISIPASFMSRKRAPAPTA